MKNCFIKFDELKVGQKVFDIHKGWTTVSELTDEEDYPIKTLDKDDITDSFCKNGMLYESDSAPTLFLKNPFEEIEYPKLCLVRQYEFDEWKERTVIGKFDDQFLALKDQTPNPNIDLGVHVWKLCKPIEELVYLTFKDISEGKGVGVPSHLIRLKEEEKTVVIVPERKGGCTATFNGTGITGSL